MMGAFLEWQFYRAGPDSQCFISSYELLGWAADCTVCMLSVSPGSRGPRLAEIGMSLRPSIRSSSESFWAACGHPQFNMGGEETNVRMAGCISYSTFVSVVMTDIQQEATQGITA